MMTPTAPTGQAAAHASTLFPLNSLADCFIGFPMQTASKATNQKVWLLQAEDLQHGPLPTELPQAIIANLPPQQCLQDGDIILAQIGAAWHAQVLTQPLPRTVCAAPLLVLRIHDATRLNPQWLCCYLHTNRIQHELCRYQDPSDAHEGVLSTLHGLHLPVPTPAKQQYLCQSATQFANIVQQTQATLNLQRQNNEALWLALAHGAPEPNPA